MSSKHKKQTQAAIGRPILSIGIPNLQITTSEQIELPLPIEALNLIKEIERLRGSRVITLFTSPDVIFRGDIPRELYRQLRIIGRVKRIDLFLHSTGGQTEIPWRIITLIRNFCDDFGVLIPSAAHSAATHIAIGANEIVMGDMSELGPTDPSRSHPLLPTVKNSGGEAQLMISVQDLRQCIEFLKRDWKNDPTPESLAAIYTALFEKVHPLALGAIEQSYALAKLISEKALKTHMSAETDKEKIDSIVTAFSDNFFSHEYRIGWKEAKELGLPVKYDNGNLWEAMWSLYEYYDAFRTIVRPIDNPPTIIARPIVWIDSVLQRQILEERYAVSKTNTPPLPVVPQWIIEKWANNDPKEEKDFSD